MVLKAVAHPMRILIIDALKKEDRCVGDLCALGTVSQSNVSRHLGMLNEWELSATGVLINV